MTTCPFTNTAAQFAKDVAGWSVLPPLEVIGSWHDDLAAIARSLYVLAFSEEGSVRRRLNERHISNRLASITAFATVFLVQLGVKDPAAAFVAEYERAAIKHPGMTLDCDGPTDELRFYALAEEAGEVAASLTYDNANSTGHNADTIAEVTQVGALALAWLVRDQEESSNA